MDSRGAQRSVRVRGLSIYRPIIYGNIAEVLKPEDRQPSTPTNHTHRWTVAVRSAASAPNSDTVGGADDLSYFIKRVTFKLHETIPNPTRNVDKPPFEVTETGWGEFEVQIRITFAPESGEKNVMTYHHLKLHPWQLVQAGDTEAPPLEEARKLGPVHSWQYDEIVFHDPFQSFLNLLMQHPPTPLPKERRRPVPFHTASIAPGANAQEKEKQKKDSEGGTPEFALTMVQEEAGRLEKARKEVIAETDKWRAILIEKENELEKLRKEEA